MAQVSLITQGLLPDNDHEAALNDLIKSEWAKKLFISVAFVREAGVSKIEKSLSKRFDIADLFIGISNGITSKQAINKLLHIGINPYVIDMGTQANIFHPKCYAAIGDERATIIIGSANLTSSGLTSNIEIGSKIELDLTLPDEKNFALQLTQPFEGLIHNHPINVFRINDSNQLDELVSQGRLEDENLRQRARIISSSTQPQPLEATPALPTYKAKEQGNPKPPKTIKKLPQRILTGAGLVWSSKELTERDLSIPTGENTNPTGSMYFKKGLLENIDQRHYFKDVVFSNSNWEPDPDPTKKHLLRSEANFQIIINGIAVCNANLKLTHNSKTDTPTYKQNNAMTQLHWGPVKPFIAQRGLLGKHMNLYHISKNFYQIEII